MHNRFMLAAVLAASLIAPLGAEPTKVPAGQDAQPASRPAEVLLASADVRAPGPQSDPQAAPPPIKRPRAARVTTCRCAGQLPEQP